ncbi:hypothetical protein [Kitasatospora indigofera]|uniref:hypothetical protein n=1 Tax=Kitasatospora indigofera TaxID=67307 RepID=UPI0036BCC792
MARVGDLHGKVRRRRLDQAHKTGLTLVRAHDFIAHDLKIRSMSRIPAPRPDPEHPGAFLPHGAPAEAGPNRSIMDADWRVPRDPHQQG